MSDVKVREIHGMFEGPILPVTIRLGLPILLANFFNFLYSIIDTIFVSLIDRSSTALISGVGIVFPVFFIFMALASGLGVGVNTLVARAIGEGNRNALRRISSSGFLIAAAISLVSLTAGYLFITDIVGLLAGKGMSREAMTYGAQFLLYIMPGLALMLFIQVIIGILQGEGKTKYIAIGMTISTVANIALDPLFIFTFHMGVAGAGLATSVSLAIASLYTGYVFPTGRSSVPFSLNIFAARQRLVREIARVGFPQSLGMLAMSIAFMLLNKLVSGIGETEMNSWSLVGRVDQFVFIPVYAISAANITMIGQNYGRRNLPRLMRVNHANTLMSIVLIAALAAAYMLCAPLIFRAFSAVDAVIGGCAAQVRFVFLTFIGVAGAVIAGGTFQGIGNPLPALAITVLRIGLVSVPLAYLFGYGLGWGMRGVFAAVGVGNLVSLPASWLWVRRHLKTLRFRAVED